MMEMNYNQVVTPLDYFRTLVQLDDELPLTEAAITIGLDQYRALDVQDVLEEIDRLGQRLKQRVAFNASPLQKLQALNRFFFSEMGFAGNVNHYYDPDNSFLHRVLETRRGVPVTLTVLYMEFAQQIELPARGVAFPGHFLIKVPMSDGRRHGEVVMDPFTGASLTQDELTHQLAPYKRRNGLLGEFDAPLGLFLQSASSRDILARILRNLKEIYKGAQQPAKSLRIQQRLVDLLPRDWEERRDLGVTRLELDDYWKGIDDLYEYLEHSPHAKDRDAVHEQIIQAQRKAGLV